MAELYPAIYKDFEVHPLVFSREFDKFDGHKRHAEGYDVAVRVCRPGAISGSKASRVFRFPISASPSAVRASTAQTSSTARWRAHRLPIFEAKK
jgi:hypothetical protein